MVEIIASEFHVDRKKAVNYANLYSGYLLYEYGDDDSFFDSDCFDDDDRRQIDIYHNMRVINVAQSRNIDPCLETVNNSIRSNVRAALEELTPREREVLDARYGLSDDICRTLDDVGRSMSVTRERVRQIEAKALRKLKQRHRSFRDYLDD